MSDDIRQAISSTVELIKSIEPARLEFINSAQQLSVMHENDEKAFRAMRKIADEAQKHRDLLAVGAKANIESRDQLIEQNKLLRKQLTEQTEINPRLEYEFKMGAREAVITRKISYWSLFFGIVGVVVAIIALIRG